MAVMEVDSLRNGDVGLPSQSPANLTGKPQQKVWADMIESAMNAKPD